MVCIKSKSLHSIRFVTNTVNIYISHHMTCSFDFSMPINNVLFFSLSLSLCVSLFGKQSLNRIERNKSTEQQKNRTNTTSTVMCMTVLNYSNRFDILAFIVATAKDKLFITETESIAKNPTHLINFPMQSNLQFKNKAHTHTYVHWWLSKVKRKRTNKQTKYKMQTTKKLWSGHIHFVYQTERKRQRKNMIKSHTLTRFRSCGCCML